MMRIIWLTICCILVGMTNVQARDSGFNPFNFMDDMFDSDDHRNRHRHRPPPPPPPHFPGYGRPAAPYAGPPAVRPQGQFQQPAQVARPAWGYPPQQPAARPVAPATQANRSVSPPPAPAPAAEPAPVERSTPLRTQRRSIPNEKPVISRDSDDSILINGRPAVFRPMGLGSDTGSQ